MGAPQDLPKIRASTTLFINGAWCSAKGGNTRKIHCPADGTFIAGVDQAIATAKDTIYGLTGAVWSREAGRGEQVAKRLRRLFAARPVRTIFLSVSRL